MKLHAVESGLLISHRHHHAIDRPGGHRQAWRQCCRISHQRVIPTGPERTGQPREEVRGIMEDLAGAAMAGLGCPDNPATLRCHDRLVTEADTKDRHQPAELLNAGDRKTGLGR